MNVLEKPYTFENKGQKLYGILHGPETPRSTAVIFLHGWGTYRIGPHRIFVEAARRFASDGFTCVRFDFRGRGESEGDLAGTALLDMIDDAKVAAKETRKLQGVSRIVLLGLCSGGEVAVGAAASNPDVDGLVLLSTPLLGRQASAGRSEEVRKTANSAKSYWQKLFLPATWKKIFEFRVNYGVIFKILFGHLGKKQAGKKMKEAELLEEFNEFKGPCIFIYGDKDPDAAASESSYRKTCAKNLKASFKTIKDANHNFYSAESSQELIGCVSEWLDENFS